MKRSTISVTGPAEAQGVPWQFWPEHLCDLSGAEIAIGGLKVPRDYFLLSSDTSGDGGGSALDDVSAHAASDLTPIELAGGANPTVSFNTQTCSAEIGGSGQPELRAEEGLSGCPASDVALDLAVSPENGGIAVLTVASPPALFFAAGPSGTYQSMPIAAPIPAQDPHGTSFGRFDAATAYDADIQVPTGIAAHHAQNSGPGPMDGGGAPGVLTIPANPVADSSAPIADSAVGPGGANAAQLQQALDESGLSVNGSGVRVGVLSDSFNDLGGAAADEADGVLPSSANVDVIKDLASGGSDEGRAMMQIIHDIAPGASLAFYTAFDSEQDFANGILALAAAGSKVIVDDVSYFDEPFFQNGVVAQAIQTVEAEGVTYITAAGNDAANGYQAAWTPISGTYDGMALTDAESFGGNLVQTITVNTEGTGYDVPLLLQWNQAYGQATSDLEILVFNRSGQLVGTATHASSGEPNNPWLEYDFSQSGTFYVAIKNLSGPNPGLIKEITAGDGLPATISGANSGTVFGHAITPGAISAGAVSAADTPAFGFSSPTAESFSSSGAGTELLFANNGIALASPDVLSPVAVSGVDNVQTTVPGGLSDFYGTSAASASLAGVAALMLSANPSLTPAQVEQIMEATALPMSNSAVSGAGLAQVDAAVTASLLGPVVTVANLTLSQASVAASSLFMASDPGGHITAYGFEDTGSGHFVLNGVARPDDQEIDITAPQLSQLTYQSVLGTTDTVDIRAEDQTGWGGWASFVATAPALVIQTDGSTSLTELANDYFLYVNGSGPALKLGGTDVSPGEFAGWSPIGAVATATGDEVAWELAGGKEFIIWNTDAKGNYVSGTGILSSTSYALELAETTFGQDLNGDGVTGLQSTVIHADTGPFGSTTLMQLADQYALVNSGGNGPHLQLSGAVVTVGEIPGWSPIGAVAIATGDEVAWELAGGKEFIIWNTDANGNYVSGTGILSSTSYALELAETTFGQDLNGDGVTGLQSTVIHADTGPFGSTTLMQLADQYALVNSGGNGPHLQLSGAVVTVGDIPGWSPVGAVQTSTNFEVAWELAGGSEFIIWNTDANGNYVSGTGVLSSTSYALESAETVFGQDLNGDGVIGLPTKVIQTDTTSYGTTSLAEIGTNYFLEGGGGSVPELKYSGAAVTAGEFGGWVPIGAVQTASGYDIAWAIPGANQYTVWSTDSSGNYHSNIFGAVAGSSPALESLESTFNQDLNGDGVIGLPTKVIQTDTTSYGTTSLAEIGNNYFFEGSGGSAPELKYSGAAVTAGEFGGWVPIGAVQTASGYDIAWEIPGANQYTVWTTDSSGNYHSNVFGAVPGNSSALESLEPTFNQDLNGDGVIGLYAVPRTTLQVSQSLAGASAAASIGVNATLELAGAYSGSVTFNASTGMLKLDNPSTFTGKIFQFTGNGSLTGSDQIDLRTISYASVHDSYESGALTVSDGASTVTLDFNGSYTLANFKFASDGSGGTIVYDPPASNSTVSGANTMVTADRSKDAFLFHPNLGQSASIDHTFGAATALFDHAEFATTASANVYNAQESTMFGDAVHDTMTFHISALAQPHHSHFLI